MKIPELRQLLSNSEKAHIEKTFAEVYKQLPKQKKEEIDPVIQDILSGKDTNRSRKKTSINFPDLKQEIQTFIENAYSQNYFGPNRIIPKNQRPKWRFLVKGYIKELVKIPLTDENYTESAKLLKELYQLICEACNYYLFSTDDAFRSIGWDQSDLFALVVKKVFGDGYTRKNISELLLLASTGGLSRESLYIYQQLELLSELKTSDVKYMAVEEAKKLIGEREAKLGELKKYDSKRYDLTRTINNLCDMILMIQITLAEPDSGIRYFFKTCLEVRREIVLYRALSLVRDLDEENDKLWLQIYEYGKKQKIEPRESLVEEYQQLIENMPQNT